MYVVLPLLQVMTYMAETARDDLQHVRAFRQLLKRFDISKVWMSNRRGPNGVTG